MFKVLFGWKNKQGLWLLVGTTHVWHIMEEYWLLVGWVYLVHTGIQLKGTYIQKSQIYSYDYLINLKQIFSSFWCVCFLVAIGKATCFSCDGIIGWETCHRGWKWKWLCSQCGKISWIFWQMGGVKTTCFAAWKSIFSRIWKSKLQQGFKVSLASDFVMQV